MDKQVNLYEAKTRLSELVEEAASGAEIIIAKNGKPKARLVPMQAKPSGKRIGGQWAKYFHGVDMGSEEWWRAWKEADAEIERDFYQGMEEDDKPWRGTSLTPTRSSRSKPASLVRKRAKSSKTRKTRST